MTENPPVVAEQTWQPGDPVPLPDLPDSAYLAAATAVPEAACRGALNLLGEHFACDANNGLEHIGPCGSTAAKAVWAGPSDMARIAREGAEMEAMGL